MKRLLYLTCILFLFCTGVVKAQDSLFFYKSGDIIYRESKDLIDSLTFLPIDYYEKYRSNVVYNDLKSNSELTRFAQMIQIAGYEKQLDNVTIWAPINSALNQINLSDVELVKKIVMNNISKSKTSTWFDGDSIQVTMINNKSYVLKKTSTAYTLDRNTILTPNLYSANSVIHVLNNYVTYKMNIWEYITQGNGHDLMKTYVNSHSKTTTDLSTGKEVQTNDLLDQIPNINIENNLYSAIIPSDDAWKDAYTKLYPYCAAANDSLTNSHDEATKFAIIHNNFFVGKLNISTTDSVFTATSGFELKKPAVVLEGAQIQELTNGNCFNVNQLKMYNPEYWNKEIRIEAEKYDINRTTSNYAISTVSANGTGFDVSRGYYISLSPTSSSSIAKLNINFPIPNTLSAKYNVYCVFVPTSIVDTTDLRPSKVKFYLSYIGVNGVKVINNAVSVSHVLTKPNAAAAIFTTYPTTSTKMLVLKDFQFPFSNLILNEKTPVTVVLKVENASGVSPIELANFNRTLRIDCIILEPVQ